MERNKIFDFFKGTLDQLDMIDEAVRAETLIQIGVKRPYTQLGVYGSQDSRKRDLKEEEKQKQLMDSQGHPGSEHKRNPVMEYVHRYEKKIYTRQSILQAPNNKSFLKVL